MADIFVAVLFACKQAPTMLVADIVVGACLQANIFINT